MNDPIATALTKETRAAASLLDALASEDATLNHDMVEGETSFMEAIDSAIAEIDECDIIASGCAAKIKQLTDRKNRAEKRTERLRGLIEQALLMADIPTAKRPDATLSVKSVPPKYLIEDETLIPSKFWKQPDPVLDRAAINKAFASGEKITGVGQTNGSTSLQIRRS